MKNKCMLIAALLMLSGAMSAKVVLPPMFSDNMVLQQQADAPIWGTAKPMKTVKITTSWDGKTYETLAGKDGKWKLSVRTPEAGGPYELTLTDGQKLVLKNVMVGEVWICSGQSNMEMPLKGWGKIMDYEKEIAEANHPDIRLLHVEHVTSTQPESDIKIRDNGWQVCSPLTVPEFSATAYFFGREISEKQNVPVGLIHTSWGGTNVESWISGKVLKEMPDFTKVVEDIRLMPDKSAMKAEYLKGLETWNNRVDEGFAAGKPIRAEVSLDDSNWQKMNFPGMVEEQGLAGFDGLLWLRRTVEIPSSWVGKKLQLVLGTIDDNDITYWNGKEVGRTNGYSVSRNYTVPGKMVKAGQVTLAIRVVDTGGGCGMPDELYLRSANGEQISLAGEWKYQVAADGRKEGMPPADMSENPNLPTSLYNAMIHPLVPYGIRGAIWYQGENNASRAYQYRELFPLVIENWRQDWGQDFPFYFVQLANFMQQSPQPADSDWAELREAQSRTLSVANTGMAVIIDKGDANDIHPKDKQAVGHRLALVARAKTYGEQIPYSGPMYRSSQVDGDKIILSFDHTDGGLKSGDGKELQGFSIAGRDHKFHWAKAEIKGDKIVVSSPEVPYPVAVRYAWANNPVCNLYNGAGLPASPFRTDDWKGVTQKN
ncbi:sialate O-acetylesterase [Bacteroides stercorirosoris]|uniref:9-O-acetylesterase n=1 Tax=Bacteroides stercorirosoris TaxID=871324 RepID=A0A413H2K7_9BACE|nr:sialate O-acetylesterase [Bacteroides stercorirosoris]RGX77728.1 9-O-acetylesterase [Bacteroides stercorirosoris]